MGGEPADSAILSANLFQKNGIKSVLIPGFGYGRNAKVFTENNCEVTGIEISETAIAIAKKQFGESFKVHHGSFVDMPFDGKRYEGVFCYALIHLLNEKERFKLIQDCFNQLKSNRLMVFVAISKNTATYGEGVEIA